jgi:branched-chain amino acid transport system ATP-binding protein
MLLEVEDLSTGYGDLPVVREVSIHVDEGEIVTVIGANGAGKTTLLSTIVGLNRVWGGSVRFMGSDITAKRGHEIPHLGLVMVPQGRQLFPFMTVEENLLLGAYAKRARADREKSLDEVYDLFPMLSERRTQRAGSLSGGQQQMCAIGRGLMAKPTLLVLDEPSLGLAPIIVEEVFTLVRKLAAGGLTIVLVEQNVHDALEMADRGYVLEQGGVVMSGTGAELLARPDLQQAYLGA